MSFQITQKKLKFRVNITSNMLCHLKPYSFLANFMLAQVAFTNTNIKSSFLENEDVFLSQRIKSHLDYPSLISRDSPELESKNKRAKDKQDKKELVVKIKEEEK